MRRLITLLAATALLGGTLAVGDGALAQGRSREARANAPGQNRAPQMREPQGRDMRQDENRGSRAYPGPSEDRRAYPPQQAYPRDDRRVYAPPQAYGPPPGYREEAPAARRGGFLPPEAGGGIVNDLNRYQLRPPPRGYAWVRVNGGFAMVSMATGQIFDIVPD